VGDRSVYMWEIGVPVKTCLYIWEIGVPVQVSIECRVILSLTEAFMYVCASQRVEGGGGKRTSGAWYVNICISNMCTNDYINKSALMGSCGSLVVYVYITRPRQGCL